MERAAVSPSGVAAAPGAGIPSYGKQLGLERWFLFLESAKHRYPYYTQQNGCSTLFYRLIRDATFVIRQTQDSKTKRQQETGRLSEIYRNITFGQILLHLFYGERAEVGYGCDEHGISVAVDDGFVKVLERSGAT